MLRYASTLHLDDLTLKTVQMTVNFAGIAGGSKLTEAMGVQESYASWIGASYACVALAQVELLTVLTIAA